MFSMSPVNLQIELNQQEPTRTKQEPTRTNKNQQEPTRTNKNQTRTNKNQTRTNLPLPTPMLPSNLKSSPWDLSAPLMAKGNKKPPTDKSRGQHINREKGNEKHINKRKETRNIKGKIILLCLPPQDTFFL